MKRISWVFLSLLSVSGAATASTIGPWLDVDQSVSPPHSGYTIIIDSWFKKYHIDHIVIEFRTAVDLRCLGYVTVDDPGATGTALVTTIYGMADTPIGAGLETTGFDPLSPEMTPVSGETIIGLSGTEYSSFFASGPTPLSNLSSLIGDPDFDLSAFQGDPSSVVYVFRTSLPVSDLPIPEPASLVLLALGAMGCIGIPRRLRSARLA